MNGYFEEINGSKYLALVLTNESKKKKKKKKKNLKKFAVKKEN